MDNFLPGSASLVDAVDKKLLLVLRDGRKLIGTLRSYDQFANLVLQNTIERIYVGDAYGDLPRGVLVIRGENVVLLGEIDLEKDDESPLRKIPVEEVLAVQHSEMQLNQQREKLKTAVLYEHGFTPNFEETDAYHL